MKNGHPVLYFNTTMKIMKDAVVNQLTKRQPVWFGSDYNKFNYSDESLLNNTVYDFKNFPYKKDELFLQKTNAISHYQTNVNHAMMLCGYYYKGNKSKSIKYFIVENSHDAKLKKVSFENNYGMVVLSNSWFEKYAVMCVVHRDHITDKTMREKVKSHGTSTAWNGWLARMAGLLVWLACWHGSVTQGLRLHGQGVVTHWSWCLLATSQQIPSKTT